MPGLRSSFFPMSFHFSQKKQAFNSAKPAEKCPGRIMIFLLNLFVIFKLILAAPTTNASSGNRFLELLMGVKRVVCNNTVYSGMGTLLTMTAAPRRPCGSKVLVSSRL